MAGDIAAAERSNRLEGQVYANLTFETTWTQDLGPEVVSLRYFGPAHTSGDAVIHFEKANVVHMGDLVFNRVAPFIDTMGGANTGHWVTVLEKVVDAFEADTRFIFGHGHEKHGIVGTKSDLIAMRDYLSELYLYVEKGLKAGKSADELASVEAFKGFEEYAEGNLKSRFQGGIRATIEQFGKVGQ